MPDEASVRLHEALDFERVGVIREVRFKFSYWLDIGCLAKLL